MKPRHVVILNWKDAEHPEAGGAEVYCTNVAKELAATGVRVTLVASRPAGHTRHARVDGYVVRRLGGRYTMYPLVLLWLFLHRRSVDAVIDSQNGIPFFSPLALRRGCAITLLVHHVHQDQFDMYFSPLMAKVGRWLEGPASRRVYGKAAISTVSPSTRTDVRQRLRLTGPIFVTPNGYRASEPPDTERVTEPRIACVGRLVPHKRWDLLIEAVAELASRGTEVRLDLVGSGPEQAALQALTDRLGVQHLVTLHGFVAAEERDRLLAQAWLSASTSVGEGWGLSVIEAAAQGVPTVAIDVAGLRDSVRHGITGWLTAQDNVADALDMALRELADPVRAYAIANACREWADALRWSWTADRFLAVLSAELKRSAQLPERRNTRSDSAMLVTLSREAARRVDPHELRVTDQLTFCPTCVDTVSEPLRIVLHGADEVDARLVLDRLGVGSRDAATSFRLCRPSDLVQWHVGSVPHNSPGLLGRRHCPAAQHEPATFRERRIA